jgi:hypothetical protein
MEPAEAISGAVNEKKVSMTPKAPSIRTILPPAMACIESTPPLVIVSAENAPTIGQISGGRMW